MNTMKTELSPAAQAVDDAFWKTINDKPNIYDRRRCQLAAALRAAAEQMSCYESKKFLYSIADAMKLQAIATELEDQP